MTALVLLVAILAFVSAMGTARQTTRTLCAWQKAMEAMLVELRGRQAPASETVSSCPCTCHPLPSARGR